MLGSQEKAGRLVCLFFVIPLEGVTFAVLRKHTKRCGYFVTTHSHDTYKSTALSVKYFEIKGANLLAPFIMTSLDKVRFIVSFRYPHLKGNAEFGVVRGAGNPDVFDRKD